jgi:hypothetical protein
MPSSAGARHYPASSPASPRVDAGDLRLEKFHDRFTRKHR